MGEPVDFAGSNRKLLAPRGAENVGELSTFTNGFCSVSCWKLTADEIDEVNRTGCVFLSVLSGSTQPPVFVGSEETVRSVVVDYGDVWRKAQMPAGPLDDAGMGKVARAIIAHLPDDDSQALSVLALTFASAITSMGKSDRSAFSALGLALKEARAVSGKSNGRVVL